MQVVENFFNMPINEFMAIYPIACKILFFCSIYFSLFFTIGIWSWKKITVETQGRRDCFDNYMDLLLLIASPIVGLVLVFVFFLKFCVHKPLMWFIENMRESVAK